MNTPVSFELAKILKKKEFNLSTEKYYHEQDPDGKSYVVSLKSGVKENRNFQSYAWQYSAPTITEIVMWLYEKHGIWIVAWKNPDNPSQFYFEIDSPVKRIGDLSLGLFNSPTEAYENAIEHTLKNLIP